IEVAQMQKMMAESTPEERQKGMAEWGVWMKNHTADFADMGGPVGKNTRVAKSGTAEVSNDIGGYSVIQAESKEAAIKLLADNPHFTIPGATIELMEITSMGN
ncbi:MAG: hypothetical protein MN733_04970, partial [Nitrososphaera sp.]|nr:hypothetical protein [Nitrososphaera sp.]